MSIENNSTPYPAQVSLDSFRQVADQHETITLSLEGDTWQVKGAGTMPGSGRQVLWVESSQPEVDTASAFIEALQSSYSSGISRAVARELDLKPSPGVPLASRTVKQAVEMAEVSAQVLSGVDFASQLRFSATGQGTDFRRIQEQMNLDPPLSQAERREIDERMEQFFAQSRRSGVAPEATEIEQWLRATLESFRRT